MTRILSILTKNIKTYFLTNIAVENVRIFTFDKYPSHTQSVERHVRLVSHISSVISSLEERDGRINVTFLEKKLMSRFSSKQKLLLNNYFFNQRLFSVLINI